MQAVWDFVKSHAPHFIWTGLVIVAAVLVILFVVQPFKALSPTEGGAPLQAADEPPLEYGYLDSPRVADYLGQLENGLASSEQRTEQLSRNINASISSGTFAQVGASQQTQEGTQSTVTPTAADRFYHFERLLRAHTATCGRIGRSPTGETTCLSGRCNTSKRTFWLGDINDQASPDRIIAEVACIGVGNFVRLSNTQLFVPPFVQPLPRAQSANAFYGKLPSLRTPFTSPTQSAMIRAGLQGYVKLVGPTPRLPFIAAPYGLTTNVGKGVTFFLPTHYVGLTAEPSLLSGSVTIVGKIIYYAPGGNAYIDYPTISELGQPLLQMGKTDPDFLNAVGVCSKIPPSQTQPKLARISGSTSNCTSPQQTLDTVTASVTFRPPIVVVLPVAIYQ
jgi:hypothetical protein